ncbi:MAG: PEP-CTERM sorting domain-containing protein, partial [Deltaproteobacteria bacterium]|nr:PEP-CTERM sorting domain-containing protein [Deltaproteobacteria bacterium]
SSGSDGVSNSNLSLRSYDLSAAPTMTWTVFAPVPEPGTGVLATLGLLTMAVRARRGA